MFDKDYRLILKNLPLSVSSSKLEEIIGKYGSVTNVNLKEKNDTDDKKIKFAFVNITTSHKQLNQCINDINKLTIDGYKLNIDLAKESFLERLKRERAEAVEKADNKNTNNNVALPVQSTLQDPDLDGFKIKGKNKKRKFNENDLEEIAKNVEVIEPQMKKKEKENESLNKLVKEFCPLVNQKDPQAEKVISESEKKRLMAVKERKQAMKHREWVVKNALKMVDDKLPNNKIVFDDNYEDLDKNSKIKNNKKQALFESDGEGDEDFGWDEKKLDAKAKLGSKLTKLQSNFNSDQRFVLDERFIENENEEEESEKDEENGPDDEKQWQMNILEGVLGKPMHTPDFRKSQALPKMIRYDPMDSSHAQYEIKDEKTVTEKPVKKKKNKSETVEVKEEVIPRSAEVFYEVPKNLTHCFEPEKEFSLLKTLGRETIQTDDKPADPEKKSQSEDAFKFKFDRKNPFKYDSSDDEVEEKLNDLKHDKSKSEIEVPKSYSKFFLELNDPRFQEAIDFFKKDDKIDEEGFKNRRTEIKQILRKKIRNNLKKVVPSRRKKVRKMTKGSYSK